MNDHSTEVPPDPEGMNAAGSEWAGAALTHFQSITDTNFEEAVGDLLCALMNWADRANFDFDLALERARGHYRDETLPETV